MGQLQCLEHAARSGLHKMVLPKGNLPDFPQSVEIFIMQDPSYHHNIKVLPVFTEASVYLHIYKHPTSCLASHTLSVDDLRWVYNTDTSDWYF